MKENVVASNEFCDITRIKFKKWDEVDFLLWYLSTKIAKLQVGWDYLYAYKDAYVVFNKTKIINNANNIGIPPELLGGVAWIEAGGKPESIKIHVYESRRMLNSKIYPTFQGKTSFGSVAMQIDVAARMLGIDPEMLTTRDQLELSNCLLEDDFNLRLAATYLRNLILYDFPGCASLYLTDEQYIMAGVRYNKGTERKLDEFRKIIANKVARETDEYDLISYGMRLLEIKPQIRKLLGI